MVVCGEAMNDVWWLLCGEMKALEFEARERSAGQEMHNYQIH